MGKEMKNLGLHKIKSKDCLVACCVPNDLAHSQWLGRMGCDDGAGIPIFQQFS